MLSYIAVPKWGEPMIIFAETLFWLNAVIAVVLCFGILALMYFILSLILRYRITYHAHTISSITGILIFPVLPLVVLSATGAALCSVVPSTSATMYRVLIASYVFCGMGFPLGNVILVLCFLRLVVHKVSNPSHIQADPSGPLRAIYSLFCYQSAP